MTEITGVGLEGAIAVARSCVFGRLPIKAQRLQELASHLDESDLSKLRDLMLHEGVLVHMVRRATDAAPCGLKGPLRIIGALEAIQGREATAQLLREHGYRAQLIACAQRFTHPKKHRLNTALELLQHVAKVCGLDPELEQLIAETGRKLKINLGYTFVNMNMLQLAQ